MGELVSVLMTTYNEKVEWIQSAIESMINQTYKNIEIIVAIDKPDEMEITEVLNAYKNRFSHIKIIVNKTNMGLAGSLNECFKLAKGKYIARMDADDISEKNRLELQVKELEENPDIHLVTASCRYINEYNQVIGEQSIGSKNAMQVKKGLKYINFIIHPSWLMRREAFEELGGYRQFECSQDYDFLLRMISHGLDIKVCKKHLIQYRVRSNSISSSKSFKQYLIAKYIRELYEERNKKGIDSFSLANLNQFLIKNQYTSDMERYDISHKKFMSIREEGNKIKRVMNAFQCLVLSKYSRDLLISSVLFKVSTKNR
ncbi:glycosyltransferase [Bacillus toyonensis]|uniref:glycosyltransferase n=1 Tax=Bacillus toyonensis TaxID=155322 RepID=UPI000BF20FC2|nr:glycosyltransferase [Bacillus toyonensis]PEJ65957.1 glycosyl transferase family 2 [Bacillus toyonensis]PEN73254.1 glycosyl transferase family 2 [Bacillus toyonensis]PGB35501.1 glycosyl transferase family 2 [Bacillus toyonensis]